MSRRRGARALATLGATAMAMSVAPASARAQDVVDQEVPAALESSVSPADAVTETRADTGDQDEATAPSLTPVPTSLEETTTHRGADKRFYVRFGPLHMQPNVSSDEINLSGVEGTATLAVMDGPIAGSSSDIESLTVAAAIVGARWPVGGGEVAVETILALPITLNLRAGGTLATESIAPTVLDGIETGIPALGSELGTTKALPPTVTAVYRYPITRYLLPYAGAGASYLFTYDSKVTNPVLTDVVEPSLEISNGWSAVAQAGLDIRLKHFSIVLDVKYMTGFDIRGQVTDVYVRTTAFPLYDAVNVGDATLEARSSPIIFHAGAGFDF